MVEFAAFTGIATVATIGPVYKIRKGLSKIFSLPFIGWALSLAYGVGTGYLLLKIFSFQSSMAGLANLASSILFTGWLYMFVRLFTLRVLIFPFGLLTLSTSK